MFDLDEYLTAVIGNNKNPLGPKPPMGTPPIVPDQRQAPLPSYNDTPAYADPSEDIEVTGDGWKPKKRSTLGTIADMLFGKPIFANRVKSINVNRAMQGFAQDPLQAIRRLSQINGMEGKAWDMYNQYSDNKRADETTESANEVRQDRARDRVGGMLGAILSSNDPAGAYTKNLPVLRRYLESKKIDPTELPDQWDADWANTYRNGGISVDAQEDNQRDATYKGTRLGQYQQSINNTEQYRQERLGQISQTIENTQDYREKRLGQIDEAQNEKGRHNRAVENKQNIPKEVRADKPDGTVVYSPDGAKAKKAIGGQWYYFKKGPDGRHIYDPSAPLNKGRQPPKFKGQ